MHQGSSTSCDLLVSSKIMPVFKDYASFISIKKKRKSVSFIRFSGVILPFILTIILF